MRVGMVCPYSLSEPGGVQGQVLGLARALTRLGHRVTVIAPGDAPAGMTVQSVGRTFQFRVNGSTAPMAPHPLAAARTLRAVQKGGFDVLHLHEPLAPSITIPTLLAHPAPIVATFHAAGDQTPYRWTGRSLRRLADRIDARVAVSEPAERLAWRHLGGSYEVLFNGVDLGDFIGEPRPQAKAPTILFLGRHEPRKGLDVLLEALSLLPPEVTVRVAGEGPATVQLRDRHSGDPRISWLGRLSDGDKVRHLHAASVLCAPSRHGESFGMVLLEAMAAGTPAVASDLPGYRLISDQGRAVHLVPPDDPPALAEGLRRVLFDDRLRIELRARGIDRARLCSLDALALRYVQVYERTVTSGLSAGSRTRSCRRGTQTYSADLSGLRGWIRPRA